MKLKRFNESIEESDADIIKDCFTIINYEFPDIEYKIYHNLQNETINIDLGKWMAGYGDLHQLDNYLKFNPDYIKFNQLFHSFLQEMNNYFGLSIISNIRGEKNIKIGFNRLDGSSRFKYILNKDGILDISFLKEYLREENLHQISIISNSDSNVLLYGVDNKDLDKLEVLVNGLNKISPVNIGFIYKQDGKTKYFNGDYKNFDEMLAGFNPNEWSKIIIELKFNQK